MSARLFQLIKGPLKSPKVSWKTLGAGGSFFLLLAIAASVAVGAEGSGGHIALPFFLWINAMFLSIAAYLVKQRERPLDPVPDLNLGTVFILVGGFSLYIQMAIRLLFSSSFGGSIGRFDFGLKCGFNDGTPCTEENIAFKFEFNSFGHCIQGCLSILLFPFGRLFVRKVIFRQQTIHTMRCIRLAGASLVVAYPAYNIIKRCIKAASEFASSSFSNNASEWAAGFALGISTGLLFSALFAHEDSMAANSESEAPDDEDQGIIIAFRVVQKLQAACGALLVGTSIVSAAMFGLTWDNSAAKGDTEDDVDAGILLLMLCVPGSLILGSLILFWKGTLNTSSESFTEMQEIGQVRQ